MVLVTPEKIKDLLIEKLQTYGIDFEPFTLEQEYRCGFQWDIVLREEDLLDINDIRFHVPTLDISEV